MLTKWIMPPKVIVAEHPLSEYGAKMQSYPIFSRELDVDVFQGRQRSSIQPLQNLPNGMFMTCLVDYLGASNAVRTARQSDFEALFQGLSPVKIDIGDGFWYWAFLVQIGDSSTRHEYVTTVEYRFRVTRHKDSVILPIAPEVFCHSNVERTDCVLTFPAGLFDTSKSLTVELNGLSWTMASAPSRKLVLDGVNKIFKVGSANATNAITWTDFPYLIPGRNTMRLLANGTPISGWPATASYTPTYL